MKRHSPLLALVSVVGSSIFFACVGDTPSTELADSGPAGLDGGGMDGGTDASIDARVADVADAAADTTPDAAIACATSPGPNGLTTLGSGQHPAGVAVDCANVYWTSAGVGTGCACVSRHIASMRAPPAMWR